MVKKGKALQKIMAGSRNIRFDEFVALLEEFGFTQRRIQGSHHIFRHPDVPRSFPIQPRPDGKAKPYQIQQFLKLIEKYNLRLDKK